MTVMPRRSEVVLQEIPRRRIQLTLHQMADQVDDHGTSMPRRRRPAAASSQHTATDDDSRLPPGFACSFDHLVGVVQIAVGRDLRQVLALHWHDEGGEPVAMTSLS